MNQEIKKEHKKVSKAKRAFSAFLLLSTLYCSQPYDDVNTTCEREPYAKVAKDVNGKKSRGIVAENESLNFCGGSLKFLKISDDGVDLIFLPERSDVQIKKCSEGIICLECTDSNEGKFLIESTGKKIEEVTCRYGGNSVFVKEGESFNVEYSAGNTAIVKLVRAFLTKDNKVVIYFEVYDKNPNPTKVFVETPGANLEFGNVVNISLSNGIKFSITGYSVCGH